MPQLARNVLAPAMPRTETEVLFAEAEAALRSGEIEQGLAVLDVLTAKNGETDVTARMRAEALTSKGDIEGAARALAAAQTDPDRQAELAWASGDWSGAMEGTSPERSALAAYMTGAGELPEEIRQEMDPARLALFESLLTPTELPEDLSLEETKKMLEQVEAEMDLLKELREGG